MNDASHLATLSVHDLQSQEIQLILYIRQLRFGVIHRLIVRDGLPRVIEEATRTIILE